MGLLDRRAAVLAFSIVAAAAAPARASSPCANYVVPSRMEFLPDEANATMVVIHGAFFFWQNGGNYSAPACGYMYFTCPPGSEKMCRLQWQDIKAGIGGPGCEGFGPQNVSTSATLRVEGTPLGRPDTWDLGMGVAQGFFVGGQCAPAMQLKCPPGGPSDMAMAPRDLAMPPPPPADLAMASKPDLATTPAADLSAAAPPDLAKSPMASPGSCATAGHGGRPSGVSLLGLAGAGLALVLRARRRRAG